MYTLMNLQLPPIDRAYAAAGGTDAKQGSHGGTEQEPLAAVL